MKNVYHVEFPVVLTLPDIPNSVIKKKVNDCKESSLRTYGLFTRTAVRLILIIMFCLGLYGILIHNGASANSG